ncbi:mitochondrial inner membrane protease ATP23 isoform X3 [Ananas comosus]|uniref:Mitochondrial inner membrane protease ATP23 n=1 Tax=Ananas comosus TaxID=4615 RepID=A0A6P5GWS6_ANACO|nr:mitochondrial inner membrane protease ATP23 isoform X3 [Ananas comosus]
MAEEDSVPIHRDFSASTGVETSNPHVGMSQDECVDRIRKSLKHPTVRFLREHMEKAGCPVWPRLLTAANCADQGSAGGYASRQGVTICCNHMTIQDEINQVVIHELIHAYDDCRAKNLDWKNCAHHACSEIRANHLSGDCHYKRELLRGFMKIRGHEQVVMDSSDFRLLFSSAIVGNIMTLLDEDDESWKQVFVMLPEQGFLPPTNTLNKQPCRSRPFTGH